MYAEIIYETGNSSVAYYENNAEMQEALAEHHKRAVTGQPGTGQSAVRNDLAPEDNRIGTWVAERIKKVYLYDEHPATFGEDQLMTTDDLKKAVDAAVEEHGMNDLVPVQAIAASIRDMSSPLVRDPKVFETKYKAPETEELDLKFLKGVETEADNA